MTIGSGLGSQLMFAAETTVGTAITVTKSLEHIDESIVFKPTWLESVGIKSGLTVARASRVSQSRFTVEGDMNFEALDKGMGLLLKHALGSSATATQIATTGAYVQVHQLGDMTGLGLTIQVGRPQPDGTVRAHTYRGCKIKSWEFSCSDGENGKWKFTVDGWQESTATGLAATAYPTNTQPFTFADSAVVLGGTVSFTTGVVQGVGSGMTLAGGAVMATLAKGVTIKGENMLATDRYGLGNTGVKKEQIQNGFTVITADLDGEYTSQGELYSVFKAATTTAFQIGFSHGAAGGANPFQLNFLMPACKLKDAGPNVTGPDIVQQKVSIQAYDPEVTSCGALQIYYVSTDTAL